MQHEGQLILILSCQRWNFNGPLLQDFVAVNALKMVNVDPELTSGLFTRMSGGFSSVIRLWAENSGQTVDGREESSAPAPSWSNSAHLASRDLPILLISGSVAVLREAIEASRKEFGGREGRESKESSWDYKGEYGRAPLSFKHGGRMGTGQISHSQGEGPAI